MEIRAVAVRVGLKIQNNCPEPNSLGKFDHWWILGLISSGLHVDIQIIQRWFTYVMLSFPASQNFTVPQT